MGFRFRRSIKVLPGVRVNVGKGGTSLSVGGRGATANISKRGVKTTVGIPGTGISYTSNPVKYDYSGYSDKQPVKKYSRGEFIFSTICFVILTFAGWKLGYAFIWIPFGILSLLGASVSIFNKNW